MQEFSGERNLIWHDEEYPVMIKLILFMIMVLLPSIAVGAVSGNNQVTGTSVDPGATDFKLIVANGSVIEGGIIPDMYTCSGPGISPEISWSGVPNRTKSLLCILDDPDAPAGLFTHWTIYNLEPSNHNIPEDFMNRPGDQGIKLGLNSVQKAEYFAPCPPSGQEHRYVFSLYALDISDLREALSRAELEEAITGHIIDNVVINATFKK